MNIAPEDETIKELQRQNDELLKIKKEKEIQHLQAENERLRKEIECDAMPRTEPQEITNPMLSTHKDRDLRPPETMNQRWSTYGESDLKPRVETREPSDQKWNTYRDCQKYSGDNSMFSPDLSRASASATHREVPRQPQFKMPSYDGNGHIDEFFIPFERLADKYQWSENEKVDNLFQSVKGSAMQFVCSLPRDVTSNYRLLTGHLSKRYGYRDPASSVRRKLSELRQKNSVPNEVFADEVRTLTTRAYPGVGTHMLDEISAEAFLKGFKNSKLAYEAMNQKPSSLNEALEVVTFLEHNYKATVTRDLVEKTRRVTFNTEDENAKDIRRINPPPTYTTVSQLDQRMTKLENMLDQVLKQTKKVECFNCAELGHYARDCQQPQRTNRNERLRTFSPGRSPVRRVIEDQEDEFHFHSTPNGKEISDPEDEYEPRQIKQIRISSPNNDDSKSRGIHLPITVNNKKLWAVVDTGADATVMSFKMAKQTGITLGSRKFKLLNAEDKMEMVAYGGVTATFQIANISKEWPIYVAPIKDDLLLGLNLMKAVDMNVLTRQGDVTIGGVLFSGRRTKDEEDTDESSLRISLTGKTNQIFSSPETSVKFGIENAQRTSSTEKIKPTFRSPDTFVKLESSLRTSSREKCQQSINFC